MSRELDELYTDHILDHFESPYHRGHLEQPTCAHHGRNPICGDELQLELLVDDAGRVEQAYFDGSGCAISQAAASILCGQIEGKTVEELRALEPTEMLDLLRVPLTATRKKCGLLGFTILKTILYSLDSGDQDRPKE